MIYTTKINSNIMNNGLNYNRDSLIIMNGHWIMNTDRKFNKAVSDKLKGMMNIDSNIDKILEDKLFNKKYDKNKITVLPIIYGGNRVLVDAHLEYRFLNNDYLEMINLSNADIYSTDSKLDIIFFRNKENKNEYVGIMPVSADVSNFEYLKRPYDVYSEEDLSYLDELKEYEFEDIVNKYLNINESDYKHRKIGTRLDDSDLIFMGKLLEQYLTGEQKIDELCDYQLDEFNIKACSILYKLQNVINKGGDK